MNENQNQNDTSAWESAMSRDFDHRVRDLHEAPISFDSVKGKAMIIQRNRRIAVAGGALAVAAVVTPVAIIATNTANGSDSAPPPLATQSTEPTATPTDPVDPTGLDVVEDGVWHRADGIDVTLPANRDYFSAVVWNDHLVVTRVDGEVYAAADVIDAEGNVIDTFDTTSAVVVNDEHTTMAWVDTDGNVLTRWVDDDLALGEYDEVSLGEVSSNPADDSSSWSVAAISGGPNCYDAEGGEGDGCMAYLNNSASDSPQVFDSHGINDNPVSDALLFADTSGTLITTRNVLQDDLDTCGGLFDLEAGDYAWETCEYRLFQISPAGANGISVAAADTQYDGLGAPFIAILGADGTETGRFAPESGFVRAWAWAADGRLVFDAYDGANWHLYAMATDGEFEELAEPIKGEDDESPFLIPGA